MLKKENLPLIVGLTIPVLMVIALAGIIYLPRLYVEPQYDFVYAVGDYPTYFDDATGVRVDYRVVNSELVQEESEFIRPSYPRNQRQPTFYRYAVETGNNIELTQEEVQQLSLNNNRQSPDGFKLTFASDTDNVIEAIFGGGRDYSQYVLEKGSVTLPINLVSDAAGYQWNQSSFLGWVDRSR